MVVDSVFLGVFSDMVVSSVFSSVCSGMVGSVVSVSNGMRYFCCTVECRSDELPLALVQVSLNNKIAKNRDGRGLSRGWEVWVLRPESRSSLGERGIVRFPSNEEFGTYAWSFQSKEAALRKIEELMVN